MADRKGKAQNKNSTRVAETKRSARKSATPKAPADPNENSTPAPKSNAPDGDAARVSTNDAQRATVPADQAYGEASMEARRLSGDRYPDSFYEAPVEHGTTKKQDEK